MYIFNKNNGKYCNLQNYMLEYRCLNSYFKSNNFFDKIQKIKNREKVRKEEKNEGKIIKTTNLLQNKS